MFRRATALVLLALVVTATPAFAGQSEYVPSNIAGENLGDGQVRVTGDGCPPGGAVDFSVTKDGESAVLDSGSVVADDDGAFTFIVDVGGETGDFLVSVSCGGNTQVLGFSIAAAAAGGAGDLPRTGDDTSIPLARMGAVLIAIGGLAVYVSKRRSNGVRVSA